ncbi:DHH family phosphoesterase [Cytobacillus gottheilii]|uniref:DHH family phosphoesterase n=1 Tax=Cytobacillus gottheilii TaxID=859144 RepID=UPI0009B954F5|nr:DHH family phosphoesterase [Cytobacillus gottheilii]
MHFKLLGSNDYELDPVGVIFQNRGVKDYNRLINLDEKAEIHFSKLKNIDKAVNLLLKHIEANSIIYIQPDSDCDGYCSFAMLLLYLNKVFPNIQIKWKLHDGKQHGINLKDITDDIRLVIIPDAGTNQYKEHAALSNKGIDVIVLDHHECEKESKHAIVVNSQLSPDYSNKNISGAGIVYKFCQALDEKLGLSLSQNYLDLVAIGNIGDIMDLREIETRYLVKKGLDNIKNPLIKAIIEKQDYSMNSIINIHNVAFFVVPLINAAVRAATEDEKIQMVKSFLESDEKVYYKRKNEFVDIHTDTARMLGNIRNRQNKLKSSNTEVIKSDDELVKNVLEDKVLVIDVTEKLDKKLTGLVANELSKAYRRPVLLYRRSKGLLKGSARGYENGEVKDFREFLLTSKLFNFCEGHGNAFGFEIKEENLLKLKDYFEINLKDEIDIDSIEVDFIINFSEITRETVESISALRDEWGSTLFEPKIAITRIPVQRGEVYLKGKKNNTLKFVHNDIEFIKFYFNQTKFEELFDEGETYYVDVLGKCRTNEWEGRKTPQIEIEQIEVVDRLYF